MLPLWETLERRRYSSVKDIWEALPQEMLPIALDVEKEDLAFIYLPQDNYHVAKTMLNRASNVALNKMHVLFSHVVDEEKKPFSRFISHLINKFTI